MKKERKKGKKKKQKKTNVCEEREDVKSEDEKLPYST